MRNSISRRRIWFLGFLMALGILLGFYYGGESISGWGQWASSPVFNPLGMFSSEEERTDGGYFVLIDEQGQVLDETSRRIYPGDEYISENNSHYRVKQVDGEVARCVLLGVEELPAAVPIEEEAVVPALAGAAAADKPLVGIYNTHGGESYIRSQGISSVRGKGDITEVAAAIADRLKSQGISAVYDDTSHVPNDRSSYRRSRRTAASLMKQGARFLIDVHRDAAPASAYVTKLGGKSVARIKLVVGRQNPQRSAVLGLAKQMKAQMDKLYPGLSKGIHIGRGNYNQDLSPTSILVEIGSQRTTLEEAKAGAELFTSIMPQIIKVSPTPGATRIGTGTEFGGSWKGLGWIIGAFLVGGIGYLLVSTGSWKAAAGKLRQFGGSEWSSFFGRRPPENDSLKDDRDQGSR